MGVREDRGDLKKGEKRSATRMTSVMVSPITLMDAVYLNLKKKWVTKNISSIKNK
jgi:hypothetical protein